MAFRKLLDHSVSPITLTIQLSLSFLYWLVFSYINVLSIIIKAGGMIPAVASFVYMVQYAQHTLIAILLDNPFSPLLVLPD